MFRKREGERSRPRWPGRRLPRRYKVIGVLFGAALLGAGAGTYASWTATTNSAGNSITAGTVGLGSNSGGQKLFDLNNMVPGPVYTSCIQIENTGNLASSVGFGGYVHSGSTALDDAMAVVVVRGEFPDPDNPPTFPGCTGFTADSANHKGFGPGILYYGSLSSVPFSAGPGAVDPDPSNPEVWSPGEKHSYQILLTLSSDPSGQGQTMDYRFAWGAINN